MHYYILTDIATPRVCLTSYLIQSHHQCDKGYIQLSHSSSKLQAIPTCPQSCSIRLLPDRSGLPPPLVVRQILLIVLPPRKDADLVLDGVDEVSDDGEQDEKDDDDDGDDNVLLHHGEAAWRASKG